MTAKPKLVASLPGQNGSELPRSDLELHKADAKLYVVGIDKDSSHAPYRMAHIVLRRHALCFPLKRALPPAFTNPRRPDPFLKVTSSLRIAETARGITHTTPKYGPGWSISSMPAAAAFEAFNVIPPFPRNINFLIKRPD